MGLAYLNFCYLVTLLFGQQARTHRRLETGSLGQPLKKYQPGLTVKSMQQAMMT